MSQSERPASRRRTTLVVNDKPQEITVADLERERGRAGQALLFLVCAAAAAATVYAAGDDILAFFSELLAMLRS